MTKHNDQERALFEAAILKVWPSCPVHVVRDLLPPEDPEYGAYVDQDIRAAWVGWQARAKLPAGGAVQQVDIVAWLNTATGDTTTHEVAVMDWDDENEPVQSLMTVEQHAQIVAAMLAAAPHPVSGEQPAAQDVSGLAVALEGCINELNKYQNTPHPEGSDGARDYLVLLMNARHALAAHRAQAQGGSK